MAFFNVRGQSVEHHVLNQLEKESYTYIQLAKLEVNPRLLLFSLHLGYC